MKEDYSLKTLKEHRAEAIDMYENAELGSDEKESAKVDITESEFLIDKYHGLKYDYFNPFKNDKKCVLCQVPLNMHGTCCGWINAHSICNPIGGKIIIGDKRHPGFGQDLDEWKRNELNKITT